MSEDFTRYGGVTMITALTILWLLLGLLAAIIVRRQDGSISLLEALLYIVGGGVSLFVIFILWLEEIRI